MIGVVVATHGNLAQEMIRTAEAVVGKLAQVAPVSVVATAPDVRHAIEEAIRSVDTGEGVLLLTDLLGGSPTNHYRISVEAVEGAIANVAGDTRS